MFEMVQLLAATNLFVLAFSVLIFDIPRYTLSLLSLTFFGVRGRSDRTPAGKVSVSVIIPTFNGGSGLEPTIASLHRQTLRPVEIIVVDDGSTDETRAVAERARALGLVDIVICHGTRCGRSAAINAAARFASGELLLTVDADTVFEPTAVARLAAAFSDPRVAGASCNISINNERDSLWTGLQSVEYLMSISAGRSILDVVDAIACLSGACSMYRRDILMRQGGLDVGPGEDLEYSLRLRRLGHLIRFVPDAWAETAGPKTGISLLRQRARWDRDALRIRFMMYGELGFFHRFERLPDTLQRLDFILFDLVPTLSLPFYLVYILLLFGAEAGLFLGAIYVLLLWISIFNMALAFVMFNRSIGLFGLSAALIFPLYQGVFLKCARFFSYSSEIIFADIGQSLTAGTPIAEILDPTDIFVDWYIPNERLINPEVGKEVVVLFGRRRIPGKIVQILPVSGVYAGTQQLLTRDRPATQIARIHFAPDASPPPLNSTVQVHMHYFEFSARAANVLIHFLGLY